MNPTASQTFSLVVGPEHPCLPGHFPGQPLVPGVLLLDRIVEHVECATGVSVRRVTQARFLRALRPTERAQVSWSREGHVIRFAVVTDTPQGPQAVADGRLDLVGPST